MKISVFTDGGSRGNPGLAAGAFFVYDDKNAVLHSEGTFLGQKTNNEAEYEAFLSSLHWVEENVQKHNIEEIVWKLDSLLVVEQLNRKWKIKEARMLVLAQKAWQVLTTLGLKHSIQHIPRAQNAAADLLVNQTLDQQA
jgi:ribonuclease HI